MEQNYYSIRRILEERYLRRELVKKFDLDIDSLSGKTTLDKINYAYTLLKSEDTYLELESYINAKRDILFKILDVILASKDGEDCSQDLLQRNASSNRHTYKFNEKNKEFLVSLLDLYESKYYDLSCYMQKKFPSIEDETFVDFLRDGFIGLAENRYTVLSIAKLNDKWKDAFSEELIPDPRIKEIFQLAEDVKDRLEYLLTPAPDKEENGAALEAIKEILQVCEDAIYSIGKNYKLPTYPNLEIDQLIREMEERTKQKIQEKKERSERAKKAWDERKKRMGQGETETKK